MSVSSLTAPAPRLHSAVHSSTVQDSTFQYRTAQRTHLCARLRSRYPRSSRSKRHFTQNIPQPDQSSRHIHRIFLNPTNHAAVFTEYFSTRPITPPYSQNIPQPDQSRSHIHNFALTAASKSAHLRDAWIRLLDLLVPSRLTGLVPALSIYPLASPDWSPP
eukprot:326455-Prorocentrum_minimum.AAC.1